MSGRFTINTLGNWFITIGKCCVLLITGAALVEQRAKRACRNQRRRGNLLVSVSLRGAQRRSTWFFECGNLPFDGRLRSRIHLIGPTHTSQQGLMIIHSPHHPNDRHVSQPAGCFEYALSFRQLLPYRKPSELPRRRRLRLPSRRPFCRLPWLWQ